MAKIGQLKKSLEAATPHLIVGSIRTLAHSVQLHLEPSGRDAEGAPAYIVYAITAQGEAVNIGAAWKKQHNGREYFSMSLDDPSWQAPLSCAAFPADKAGEWDVIWNRPERAAV